MWVAANCTKCVLALLLVLLAVSTRTALSVQIAFDDVRGLIAAFGDYDSDKLTDVFVIKEDLRTFQVMKQYKEGNLLRRSVTCRPLKGDEVIVGLIPGDFHGNATMDVVLVSKNKESNEWSSNYNLRLLQGNSTAFDCRAVYLSPFATVTSQPLMMDFNGDMISDLLADDIDGERSVWLGQTNGTFEKVSFYSDWKVDNFTKQAIRDPNSNAFIDLNGDGVADLFIEGHDSMEYLFVDKSGSFGTSSNDVWSVPYPSGYDTVGASAFMDINGDHYIEHVVPVCSKTNCSILFLDRGPNQTEPTFSWHVLVDSFSLDSSNSSSVTYMFSEVTYRDPVKIPVTLRHGDLDGDGFEDIVTVMKSHALNRVMLLHNVATENNVLGRTYTFFHKQPKIERPVLAATFDLREDSKLDILATRSMNSTLHILGETNSEMFDANFIKILVASGRCPDDKCYKEGWVEKQYKVNYGTNQPGPFLRYTLLDSNGEPKKSSAGQLSQSAHFSLQVPYTVFGLGAYANYVDEIVVTVPGGNGTKREHTVQQIVPDAQVIIIPHPMDSPSQWLTKLFLTPSDIVFKTLYTLLGICLGLLFIIAVLHREEAKEDEKETRVFKQQWLGR